MEPHLNIRCYEPPDEIAVIDLWQRSDLLRPQNDPRKDIARKLSVQPELFLVALINGVVVGSVMIGYEGHRGWVNYLAVSPTHQRQGIGRRLMTEAEQRLKALGCPKINLQVRTTNQRIVAFYRAIGFGIDDVVSLGKRLEQD